MDAIGGYFSLELPRHEEYHKDAIKLNTGRNCLEYILRARKYKKVFIPYYTCLAILEPFKKLGVSYEFYHIDIQLEIKGTFTLTSDEALLYTNYYGLKQRYVEKLAQKVGQKLIVDNTQAFYAKRIEGVDTFYTCRKFFGVPDGAYLYCDAKLDNHFEQDFSYERFSHLLKRIDLSAEEGFEDFRKADKELDNQPIRRMSKLTQRMMLSVDYETIAEQRRTNYEQIHNALGEFNNLTLQMDKDAVPLVYPFLAPINGIHDLLIENRFFVACYWPNVLDWMTRDDVEYLLAYQAQPLPIDQRYADEDLGRLIMLIKKQL